MNKITIGSRIKVFDSRLFKNDIATPLSYTIRLATVVRRYFYKSQVYDGYSDVIDVIFDYLPNQISKCHFVSGVKMENRQEP